MGDNGRKVVSKAKKSEEHGTILDKLVAQELRISRLMEKVKQMSEYSNERRYALIESKKKEQLTLRYALEQRRNFYMLQEIIKDLECALIIIQNEVPEDVKIENAELLAAEQAAMQGYRLCFLLWRVKRQYVLFLMNKYKHIRLENLKAACIIKETDELKNDVKERLESEMKEIGKTIKISKELLSIGSSLNLETELSTILEAQEKNAIQFEDIITQRRQQLCNLMEEHVGWLE